MADGAYIHVVADNLHQSKQTTTATHSSTINNNTTTQRSTTMVMQKKMKTNKSTLCRLFGSAALLVLPATAFHNGLGTRLVHPVQPRVVSQAGTSSHKRSRQHQKNRGLYASTTSTNSPLDGFLKSISFLQNQPPTKRPTNAAAAVVQSFIQAYSTRDIATALSVFADDGIYENADYFQKCTGSSELERRLRLEFAAFGALQVSIVIDDMAVDGNKVGIRFHSEIADNVTVDNSRGCAFFQLDASRQQTIERVYWVTEAAQKSGEDSLRLLANASKLLGPAKTSPKVNDTNIGRSTKLTAPEQYFAAWNQRDMDLAVSVFADSVTYDDTAFPDPFTGKEALAAHLFKCADVFPPTFTFEIDDMADAGDRMTVLWHVSNGGEQLPFSQGCSFYTLDARRKIQDGIDFVDPGPVKAAGALLFVQSMKTKISQEPVRLVPIVAWVAYMYIVFFSNGILPGANALQLEQRTWEEVLNLSLNFFLVAPLLHLPFSPEVHPMLEGVFNLLLSWAAMFAGLFSDDRKDKPNLLPAIPAVAGMQFLTSAFLLPYLATRSTEYRDDVKLEDLTPVAQATESPLLGVLMGFVGSGSIAWFFLGRQAEFGQLAERWTSFVDLLSIDRVGSSFVVDLAIFAAFQAWLVDDDIKRRGGAASRVVKPLVLAAKYVPFFGMAAYLALRPSLPSSADTCSTEQVN